VGRLFVRAAGLALIGWLLVNLPLLIEEGPQRMVAASVFMGTLQRIALAVLIAGTVCALLDGIVAPLVASAAVLTAYSIVALLAQQAGLGSDMWAPTTNAISVLDRKVLGLHSATSHPVLSAFSASATVLLGVATGRMMMSWGTSAATIRRLLVIGCSLVAAGLVLGLWMPIVMYIWTPSYCLLMAGIATLSYAVTYGLVEVGVGRPFSTFLTVFGLNPLLVWVGSATVESLARATGRVSATGEWRSLWMSAYALIADVIADDRLATVAFAIVFTCFWWGVCYPLYLRKWSLRL
jgi:predicted acyltransferase